MALTRYIEEQIENAAIRGIPFTATPGQSLTLGRANYADATLVVLDFTRVNLPTFTSSLNRRYNTSTITITNDTSFRETCDQLVVMSADNNPLLVMELPAYIALNPGESLVLPPFSVNIREYDDLDNQSRDDIASNTVYDTTVLPYRAITQDSTVNPLQLTGSVSDSNITIHEIAQGQSELAFNVIGNISLIRGTTAQGSSAATSNVDGVLSLSSTSSSTMELTSSADGILPVTPGIAQGQSELADTAVGVIHIGATATSIAALSSDATGEIPPGATATMGLTGDADGSIPVLVIDDYSWEEALDASNISLLGTGVGAGITNNSDPNGAELTNSGDSTSSTSAATAVFEAFANNFALNSSIDWNNELGISTSGLTAAALTPARVDQAVNVGSGGTEIREFQTEDSNPLVNQISVSRAPLHYRIIARINDTSNFLFCNMFVSGSASSGTFGCNLNYNSGQISLNVTSVYPTAPSGFSVASATTTNPFTFTGTTWVLVDFVIREGVNNFPQYEVMVNGTNFVYNPTDTNFQQWSGSTWSTRGRAVRRQGGADCALLFWGYRTGTDFTLAEHNTDRAALGL